MMGTNNLSVPDQCARGGGLGDGRLNRKRGILGEGKKACYKNTLCSFLNFLLANLYSLINLLIVSCTVSLKTTNSSCRLLNLLTVIHS